MVKKKKDFNKVKLKVGRKIKKQNETVVDLRRRKIVLPQEKVYKKAEEKNVQETMDALVESLNSTDENVVVKSLEAIFSILKPFAEETAENPSASLNSMLFGQRGAFGEFCLQPGILLSYLHRAVRTKNDSRLGFDAVRVAVVFLRIVYHQVEARSSLVRELFQMAETLINRTEIYFKWSGLELLAHTAKDLLLLERCPIAQFMHKGMLLRMLNHLSQELFEMPETSLAEQRRIAFLQHVDSIVSALSLEDSCAPEQLQNSGSIGNCFTPISNVMNVSLFVNFPSDSLDFDVQWQNFHRHVYILGLRVLEDFQASATEYNMKRVYWITEIVVKLVCFLQNSASTEVKKHPADKQSLLMRFTKALFAVTPLKNWSQVASSGADEQVFIGDLDGSRGKKKQRIVILNNSKKASKKQAAKAAAKLLEHHEQQFSAAKPTKVDDDQVRPLAHLINQNALLLHASLDSENLLDLTEWRQALMFGLVNKTPIANFLTIVGLWLDTFEAIFAKLRRSQANKDMTDCIKQVSLAVLDHINSAHSQAQQTVKQRLHQLVRFSQDPAGQKNLADSVPDYREIRIRSPNVVLPFVKFL